MPWPLLAATALLATGLIIARSILVAGDPSIILGLSPFSRKVLPSLVAGCAFGIALGVLFRSHSELSLFPHRMGSFVIAAAGIGATEEVLFRGYIQGRFQGMGWVLAPIIAATAHTLYKLALFFSPPVGVTINYLFLAIGTLLAGIIFGWLRERAGNILPPVAGHVLFDIVVYGERAHAPWWVWY